MSIICAFAYPQEDSSDETMNELVVSCVRSAERGSSLFGSFYRWYRCDLAGKVKAFADLRELRVHLLSGDFDPNDNGDEPRLECSGGGDLSDLMSLFNRNGGGVRKVRPALRRNHHKFIYFESTDPQRVLARMRRLREDDDIKGIIYGQPASGYTSALYIATSHPSGTDASKCNCAVLVPVTDAFGLVIRDHWKKIARAYVATEEEVSATTVEGIRGNYAEKKDLIRALVKEDVGVDVTEDGALCKLYLFPRPNMVSSDLIENILGRVRVTSSAPCHIHIVTPRWGDERTGVIDELERLHRAGARISILTRHPTLAGDDGIESVMDRLRLFMIARIFYEGDKVAIHSKYVLIDGEYEYEGTFTRRAQVWMGSPNMSNAALHENFESMVKLYHGTGAYVAFRRDFDRLSAEYAARIFQWPQMNSLVKGTPLPPDGFNDLPLNSPF